MLRIRALPQLGLLLGLAVAYTVAGKAGLRLGIVHPSASLVWAPTGIALAAFLLFGARVWPAIFVGAFFVNLTTVGTVVTSFGIATGNTLEGLVGAWLVHRYANGCKVFESGRNVIRFVLLAALTATTISATTGVTCLALGGLASWSEYGNIWLTWWLGDAAGALLVAPPLILWAADLRLKWPRARILEAAILLTILVLVSLIAFGGVIPVESRGYSLGFLCIPVLVWSAVRFGPREAATALTLTSGIAVWATVGGFGVSSAHDRNELLILLQAFMAVTAMTVLVLAATVAERNRGEARMRELAVTDPLTGLANYRRLIASLETELMRSQRTERPFAVLLFDLDGLKLINDHHGHLVGSRALCRVADAIRVTCRAMDTPSRFGGDEFAVVLPETEEADAQQLADRIRFRLAEDPELPAVSVSVGIAVYPHDGRAVELLLSAADRALYGMKSRLTWIAQPRTS